MGLTTFYKLIPFVLSTLIAVLLIIVLVAGSSPSTLPGLYLVNTTNLHLPSKLSTSQYLTDLSRVTGTDLTGQPFNTTTLGISDLYTIHIFTCCAQPEHCSAPALGPSFDPLLHLRLGVGAVDKLSDDLEDALSLYKSASPMLGAVFIIAFVCVLSAPSITLLSRRVYFAGWVAMVLAGLSAVLLLVGCITGRVTSQKLSRALNDGFEDLGITADEGGLLFPAWAAIPVCFANTLLIFIRSKQESPLDFIEERERLQEKEKGKKEKERGKGEEKKRILEIEKKAKASSEDHGSGGEFGTSHDGGVSDWDPHQGRLMLDEGRNEPLMGRVVNGGVGFRERENRWGEGTSTRPDVGGEPPYRTWSVRHRDPDAWYVNYRGVQTGEMRRSETIRD
ncbi:hypothetical protein jhhlp_005983 [Lomentospora prolificans]|uniref:Uncharacterized protein n=1 Tax=Lomentospora prolificans TaxID=41688 RepID=A0A2N3N4M3_9PEZI|nr:hypothetical protein jhhlp_005983 [Lomentospora prolificans]